MGERFKVKWRNSKIEPFQKRVIYDDWYNNEYNCTFKHQEDLCNLLNKQNDEIESLRFDLDYYKTKCSSLETGLIWEERENYRYSKKVKDTLQSAYELSDKSLVFGEDVGGGKYIGQHQRIAILRLLKNLADELGVDLE